MHSFTFRFSELWLLFCISLLKPRAVKWTGTNTSAGIWNLWNVWNVCANTKQWLNLWQLIKQIKMWGINHHSIFHYVLFSKLTFWLEIHTAHMCTHTHNTLPLWLSKQIFYLGFTYGSFSKIRHKFLKIKMCLKKHELCQYMTKIKQRLFKTACKWPSVVYIMLRFMHHHT